MPTIKMLAAARKRIWGASTRANMGTFSSAPSHANALPQQGGLCLLAASFDKFDWPGQDCAMDLIGIDSRAR